MFSDPDQIELPGDPPLAVRLRRSGRARRVALSVSRLDGTVTLTLPTRASLRSAMRFLDERRDWLENAVAGLEGPVVVGPGTALPVEGTLVTLTPAPLRSARIDGTTLLVPAARPVAGALAYLRLRARDRLAERVSIHAQTLGYSIGKLTLRDTRSRWGSCTSTGDLMFCWRLIMAPPRVLDYVAAHEVAHRAQMNHSPAFWAEVAHLFPAHVEARRWLKQHGPALHRYRFSAS
ncbi:M48 family metallopeptidase [Pararhodobacter zhoushanensis]|uniref:M48 family metallopeptidase n=1 Tax=Pararhodobacter zhoushanensis TaxID=2479545 RepID=UPI000F8DE52F|nr:SprT family zinc-dependent metalloprotease [Pararhodobacter zhoushanensis]